VITMIMFFMHVSVLEVHMSVLVIHTRAFKRGANAFEGPLHTLERQ
jgi:hypothetical protein